MPTEEILPNGQRRLVYMPGETIPDHIDGEIGRFKVADEPAADLTSKGALEQDGLVDAERVKADKATSGRLNRMMNESDQGFIPTGLGLDVRVGVGLALIAITYAFGEYNGLWGSWIQ